MEVTHYMNIAIEEAKLSLREGNHGFGAVLIKDGQIIAAEHDREETAGDPTAHAELNAIKAAVRKLGKDLAGCVLITTHEPCPMCAGAIVWANISGLAFGCSIKDARSQGRRRIDLTCEDVFNKANCNINIQAGILQQACSVLYRQDVRSEIEKLRTADAGKLAELNADSVAKRVAWFRENRDRFQFISDDLLESGYRLLLTRFGITAEQAPIISKSAKEIIFHSQNFCPTLEACKILEMDTSYVCRRLNEDATDALLKQLSPKLRFTRNYAKLRPYTDYCEEMISIRE